MSASIGTMLAQLHAACERLPRAAPRGLAQRIQDEVRPALSATMQESNRHDLHEAIALLGTAAQDIIDAANNFDQAVSHTEAYAADVGTAAAFAPVLPASWSAPAQPTTPPTSVPHPSTRQTGGLEGTHDEQWARAIGHELPERPGGVGQTTGIAVISDGSGTRVVSGRDDDATRAELVLINSPIFPRLPHPDGRIETAAHVETKIALRMREQGITYAVVVINHVLCSGPYNCYNAIRTILPRGYTLVVWEPNATKPVVIEGRARP